MENFKLIDVHKTKLKKSNDDKLIIPEKKRKRIWPRILLYLVLLLFLFAGGLIFYMLHDLPSIESLKNFRPPVISEVFDVNDKKIGEFSNERRILTPLNEIPDLLKQAFIASEDDRFYEHKGLDYKGIARAFLKNILAGEVRQGGSTITQQVAKSLLLTPEKSLYRKIREAVLAFRMEKNLTKDEILYLYLNQIYLGHGAYGVRAAAQNYFGQELSELNVSQCSMLAGLVQAPSRYNPYRYMDRARSRQAYVINKMYDNHFISGEEKNEALTTDLKLIPRENINLTHAPYFVENVRRYLAAKYGDKAVLDEGLKIYTTLDIDMQSAAIASLRKGLADLDKRQGYRGPLKTLKEEEIPDFLKSLKEKNEKAKDTAGTFLEAIVVAVDDEKEAVKLDLGTGQGAILFETMTWARKPDPEVSYRWSQIKKPSQALKEGDVVTVLPAGKVEIPKRLLKTEYEKLTFFTLEQETTVEGAIVAMDPRNGFIKAMVGGYSFLRSQFNRATQALRQPGSAFKPVVYAAAIDKGYTASSMIVDAPVIFDDPIQELQWRPKNYGGTFSGKTIFRDALIKSRNVPTIKIAEDIGIEYIIDYAKKMGVSSELSRDFSMALGSSVVTPLELTKVYSVLASGGKTVEPVFIRRIEDRDGNLLEESVREPSITATVKETEHKNPKETAAAIPREEGESVLEQGGSTDDGDGAQAKNWDGPISPQTAYLITNLLKGVVKYGTGQRAQAIGRPVAGKTGTTNDNVDAWFVGYIPELVATVWTGFDEKRPLGAGEVGGIAASPIWSDFMQEAVKNIPVSDFPVPEGIVFVQIDPKTGALATEKTQGAVFEAFFEGTQPTETAAEKEADRKIKNFFIDGN